MEMRKFNEVSIRNRRESEFVMAGYEPTSQADLKIHGWPAAPTALSAALADARL